MDGRAKMTLTWLYARSTSVLFRRPTSNRDAYRWRSLALHHMERHAVGLGGGPKVGSDIFG